jgi:hypothetical protein
MSLAPSGQPPQDVPQLPGLIGPSASGAFEAMAGERVLPS